LHRDARAYRGGQQTREMVCTDSLAAHVNE
jgi:hypothetical protein